jgi:hypothetical protein
MREAGIFQIQNEESHPEKTRQKTADKAKGLAQYKEKWLFWETDSESLQSRSRNVVSRDISLSSSENRSTRTRQILCTTSSVYAQVSPIAYFSAKNQALDPIAHIGNRSSTVHTPANTMT